MIVNEFEHEDIAFVTNYSGKYAVINNKGEFLTDFIFDSIYGGSEEGLWEVKRNGKHGAIDIQGREIIPCIYDDGCYLSEGIAAENKNDKWANAAKAALAVPDEVARSVKDFSTDSDVIYRWRDGIADLIEAER